MKQLTRFSLFYLWLFIGLSACTQTDNKHKGLPPIPLSNNLQGVYDSGQALILYSYRNEVVNSEAYADWQAYLNDFKQGVGADYFYVKAAREDFQVVTSGATEFTIFLKKGYPLFLYDGFIVEPQVYTAIHQKFSDKLLTDLDKAFMPEEAL